MKHAVLVMTFCVLFLAACAHAPTKVEIPIAVPCPAPPETARPQLPIAELVPDSPPDNVIRAYAASIEALSGYARELETILSGYRRPPGKGQ